ncbi:hypothetical protein ASZ90_020120 [hydrocarbon metagenome]|uniref:Uncharacterized protein n=1 Tax=hydrocarbon metagenome TaxID=938273 RepID=A0A0W8E1F4_9ZZZZ
MSPGNREQVPKPLVMELGKGTCPRFLHRVFLLCLGQIIIDVGCGVE